MDQAATRVGHAGVETVLPRRKDLDDGAVQSTLTLGSECDHRRPRRLGRCARLLRMDGDEEIQAARARLPFEVSRLHTVSGLRRWPAAAGSARRKSQWQDTAGDLRALNQGRGRVLQFTRALTGANRYRRSNTFRSAAPFAVLS